MRIVLTFLTLITLMLNVSAAAKKPNILFIAIDDMKPLTSAYGDVKVQTPALDLIAENGLIFTRAYSQYPVCGPSRMSLLTGQRPEVNGIMNLKTRVRDINPDVLTLPQHFKNNGYETAAVGKIFDPRNVESRQTDDPASWSIAFKQTKGKVDTNNPDKLAVKEIDAPSKDFIDGAINERGIKLLQKMSAGDKPFFLGIGYKKPHLPFIAPKKFFDLYKRSEFTLSTNQHAPKRSVAKYIMNNNGELRTYAPTPKAGNKASRYVEGVLPEDQQRELLHGYYASVSFIDSLIFDLLEVLEKTGKAENTIIVVWGDHGFHLGDHGLWGKHTTMEQANRVPFIISVPAGISGKVTTPVELLDIFPTLTALAGLKTPEGLQGDNLAPLFNGEHLPSVQVAISQYKRGGAYGYSMRTDRYRYTEWLSKDKKVVYKDLYDLEADPGETVNIAELAENKNLMVEMAKLLRLKGDGLKRL